MWTSVEGTTWVRQPHDEAAVEDAVVRDVIAGSLRHDPANPPRHIGGLIELLYELSIAIDSPIDDVEALNYLQAVTGGGKLKRFAGKLVDQAEGKKS